MAQSSPSTSFQMTPNWEEWLTYQMVVLPFRGTLMEKWANRTSWNSTNGDAVSCSRRWITLGTSAGWVESSFAEKELSFLVYTKLNISQQSTLAEKKTKGILGWVLLPAGWGRWSPLLWGMRLFWSSESSSGLPNTREIWIYWNEFSWLSNWRIWHKRRGWERWEYLF